MRSSDAFWVGVFIGKILKVAACLFLLHVLGGLPHGATWWVAQGIVLFTLVVVLYKLLVLCGVGGEGMVDAG